MKILRGEISNWSKHPNRTAVTIGVFDGVHLGHQSVLAALAKLRGADVAVVTFAEHPAAVVSDQAPVMLTSLERRIELIAEHGADMLAVLEFAAVRSMQPVEFVDRILVDVMNVSHVAVGQRFRFGFEMSGDADLLAALGQKRGFTVEEVEILGCDSPVRSTVIRKALAQGHVERAASMLGRPFQIRGTVTQGDKRGRQLGFATANLEVAPGWASPRRGVYSAYARLAGEEWMPAVVNIGVRPTFGGADELVEVHILDASLDLYGQTLHVDFMSRIRPERRFDGVDDLIVQIESDVAAARRVLHPVRPT